MDKEKICTCALNRLFGFRPEIGHSIIEKLGCASALFEMDEFELDRLLGPYSDIRPFINEKELEDSETELERLYNCGSEFICHYEKGYPSLLKECNDSPLGLYCKGQGLRDDCFNSRPQIAIVGTRDISLYGSEWCRKIVERLAMSDVKPLIVSGLAIGTDSIAHNAALEAGLPTAAVLPTGIDSIYPRSNIRMAGRLAETPECELITDYPPGTSPQAINFIRRNRIIAGICSSTVLIESKAKGGGMITARLASSYSRDVLVLPGRVDDLRSQGCNQLLKEKLAEPITDLDHMMEILGLSFKMSKRKISLEKRISDCFRETLDSEEIIIATKIAECIKANRGIDFEEICAKLILPYNVVSKFSLMLESEKIILVDILQRCVINTNFS